VSKRNYRANLAFVESAFEACWRNAQDLVSGAKLLLDNERHAQALSLSVLALEELGKLFCIDGLLFARTDDHKAEAFAKSLKSHSVKLDALVLFPLLLGNLASVDPRYRTEARFAQALAISITDLKNRGNVVFSMLVNASFRSLDRWKQTGFYAQPTGNTFIAPASAVTPEVANSVYELAWRAETTLDFVLKGGNLKRYINSARAARAKLTEADHQKLEEMGEAMFVALFGESGKEDDA
jgi:AbiV family abortive infection protein